MNNITRNILLFGALIFSNCSWAQWSYVNMVTGRFSPSAAATDSKLFFAGGGSDASPNYYDVYDYSTNAWSHPDLPHRSQTTAIGSLGNKVYFARQFDVLVNKFSNVVDILDARTGVWTKDSLSLARGGMAIRSLGSKIFFAGGSTSQSNSKLITNRVDIYDTLTQTWSIDTLSIPRTNMVSCRAGNKLFFTGGSIVQNNQLVMTDVIDVYDGSTAKWTTLHIPVLRSNFALVSAGYKVFFAGGTTTTAITDLIDIYDASTNAWTTDKLSVGKTSLAGVNIDNQVLFAGGNTNIDRPTTVDILDLTTGIWSTSSMLSGRSVLTGIALRNKAFFAGGSHSGSASGIVEIYTSNCSSTPTSVTSDPSICKGASTTLIASGASTYSWNPVTGLSAAVGSSVSANPATTTLYEVTGTDVAGCKTKAYTNVTVMPIPDMIPDPGNATICSGETIRLSAYNVVQAAWSPSSSLTPIGYIDVFAKPLETTTYTVIGKNYQGCADTATVAVTVKTSPSVEVNLDGPGSLCEGQSTNLVASGNAISYSWMPTDVTSPITGLNVTATPTVSTEYKVIGRGENNCTDTASVFIVVNTVPERPSIHVISVDTLHSSSETDNQWYKDGELIVGATDKIFKADESGIYTVQVIRNNCSSLMSEPVNIVITGLEKHTENALVHPNPADDVLIIDMQDFVSNVNIELRIIDTLGRLITKTSLSTDESTLNIKQLTPGIYILQVDQLQKSKKARFQKK